MHKAQLGLALAVALSAPSAEVFSQAAPSARTDRYGDPLPPGAMRRLGTTRFRGGLTTFAAFLPGDRRVLSVTTMRSEGPMTVWEWDAATGKCLRRFDLEGHNENTMVALTRDGKTLAVYALDSTTRRYQISLWDLPTAKPITVLHRGDGIAYAPLALSADGHVVAAQLTAGFITVWDRAADREQRIKTDEAEWESLQLSPDGNTLVGLALPDRVRCWDTSSGKERYYFRVPLKEKAEISAPRISPDGKTLALCWAEQEPSGPCTIQLRDPQTGKAIRRWKCGPGPWSLAFSPDSKVLAHTEGIVSGPRHFQFWDIATGQSLRRFPAGLYAYDVVFSTDGTKLLSPGQALQIRDAASGKDLLPLPEAQRPLTRVRFSPSGDRLVCTGFDGVVRVWDPRQGRLLHATALAEDRLEAVAQLTWPAEKGPVIALGRKAMTYFVDPATGKRLKAFPGVDRKDSKKEAQVSSAVCSPDGRTLAVAIKDEPLRLIDVATGTEESRLPYQPRLADQYTFSGDGQRLAILRTDPNGGQGLLHLWDRRAGKETRRWAVAQGGSAVFSPDGRWLAELENFGSGVRDRRLHFWDVQTGKGTSYPVPPQARSFDAPAFAPDGRMLAWASMSGHVYFWEKASGKVRAVRGGHRGWIWGVAFAPDGRTVASASWDTTVLIWDATGAGGEELGKTLTEGEARQHWADLASTDAERAFRALGRFTAAAGDAVAFFRKELRPARAAAAQEVALLIGELDSERFPVREKARQRLEQVGELAEPALRKALKAAATLECRRRVEKLLELAEGVVTRPDKLREIRAVEVLERIGTPGARDLLRELARGVSEARLTREARDSVERLTRRAGAAP
jgi:WD40 repeat protein